MGSCCGIQKKGTTSDVSNSPIEREAHSSFPEKLSETYSHSDWFNPQFHDKQHSRIKKPDELESILPDPSEVVGDTPSDRVLGSLLGLALGDALGAHVEFRPRQFLLEHPVTDLQSGGTWSLKKGQFTDDTSMALCLAISLIARHGFSPYDQLVRYKWWYRQGYMSSTGECFDIGKATSQSLREFERRQKDFGNEHQIHRENLDFLSDQRLLEMFNPICGDGQAAGNGGLMRLSPVPLFFYNIPKIAVENSGISARTTHGDERVYDACRFYGALIVAAVQGETKDQLLDRNFYQKHKKWFGDKPLHQEIQKIAEGSYKQKKQGYDDGIRGKGFIVLSLEAALWAFYFDDNSFEKGVLSAVNLGDDADTTAAIYGQLAGAYYGSKRLPPKWIEQVYAKKFIAYLAESIVNEGNKWSQKMQPSPEDRSSKQGTTYTSKGHVEPKSSSQQKISDQSRSNIGPSKRRRN